MMDEFVFLHVISVVDEYSKNCIWYTLCDTNVKETQDTISTVRYSNVNTKSLIENKKTFNKTDGYETTVNKRWLGFKV